eukprot:13817979-Alexandrium_andersonii.AAC.1
MAPGPRRRPALALPQALARGPHLIRVPGLGLDLSQVLGRVSARGLDQSPGWGRGLGQGSGSGLICARMRVRV